VIEEAVRAAACGVLPAAAAWNGMASNMGRQCIYSSAVSMDEIQTGLELTF
jgi:hypothetical protein